MENPLPLEPLTPARLASRRRHEGKGIEVIQVGVDETRAALPSPESYLSHYEQQWSEPVLRTMSKLLETLNDRGVIPVLGPTLSAAAFGHVRSRETYTIYLEDSSTTASIDEWPLKFCDAPHIKGDRPATFCGAQVSIMSLEDILKTKDPKDAIDFDDTLILNAIEDARVELVKTHGL